MSLERVTISMSVNGQVLQNVLHFNNFDGNNTHTQIKDELLANWITPWRSHQVSALVYNTLEVRTIKDGPDPITTFPLGGLLGLNGGLGQHIVVGYLIQFRAGLVGRRFRGRAYIPGSRGDYTTNNQLNTTGVTNLTNICAALKARYGPAGTAPGLRQVIWHRDGVPTEFTSVDDYVPRQVLGIQRRRNIGVGI